MTSTLPFLPRRCDEPTTSFTFVGGAETLAEDRCQGIGLVDAFLTLDVVAGPLGRYRVREVVVGQLRKTLRQVICHLEVLIVVERLANEP